MTCFTKPGWHSRGYLPHFDANTLLQHVVFCTHNALPKSSLEAVPPNLSAAARWQFFEDELDKSATGRLFSSGVFADEMQSALNYFDGDRYDLQAWCVMPNHVHVLLVAAQDILIGNIVKSWKQAVALKVNRMLGKTGAVFAPDYFDRYVRNLAQAERSIAYIEANPIKASLCQFATDWRWSSAQPRANGWKPRHDRLPVFLE